MDATALLLTVTDVIKRDGEELTPSGCASPGLGATGRRVAVPGRPRGAHNRPGRL